MVDFRAFSLLDAVLGEPNPTGTNPYKAGVFFSGSEFITDQFVQTFTELLADERLAVFIKISAKPNATCLVMRHSYVAFSLEDLGPSFAFYFLNGNQLFPSRNIPINSSRTFDFIGSSVPPTVLVLTDENGDFRYITCNPSTFELTSTGTPPPQFPQIELQQFFGEHIEFIAIDGASIYWMTVNSSNVISFTLNRVEPQRTQPIYISHGHQKPYLDGHLYLGHLNSLGDISTRIERTETSFGGVATPSAGMIKVSLADGYFDFLANQSWDTRDVEIIAGLTTQAIGTYEVILRANTEYVEWDEDELSIVLKDHSILFDRDVQINTYKGTGGYEGTAEVLGKVKPLCLGHVEHAEPVLLNPNLNLYQFHDGPSHPIIEIREGGAVRPGAEPSSNILNWNPTANDVNQGIIRVDFAVGVFRLAAPPARPITFTKHGHTDISLFATASEIISYMLRRAAPELLIDANSFDYHYTVLKQPYGLYLRDPITLKDAIRKIAAPLNDVVSVSRTNVIKLNHLVRRAARAFITDRDIVIGSKIRRREPPKPGNIYKLGHRKTWKMLDESQLLGSADQVIRHLMQSEYRWNEFTVENRHAPNPKRFNSAKGIELASHLLLSQSDLLVEIAMRDYVQRDLYEITVMGFSFSFDVCDTVLFQLDRWNMNTPRTMVIVEITEMSPTFSSEDQTRLLLWG